MKIVIINGPNLNLLGQREPAIYGSESLDDLINQLKFRFPEIEFVALQSNLEGDLVNWVQEWGFKRPNEIKGIIINPGGYSHTSVAIADAIGASKIPVIEVHISNIHAREEYRHNSITGSKCKGIITGLGTDGYRLAIDYLLNIK